MVVEVYVFCIGYLQQFSFLAVLVQSELQHFKGKFSQNPRRARTTARGVRVFGILSILPFAHIFASVDFPGTFSSSLDFGDLRLGWNATMLHTNSLSLLQMA